MDTRDVLILSPSSEELHDNSVSNPSKNTSSKYIFHSLEKENKEMSYTPMTSLENNDFKRLENSPEKFNPREFKFIRYASDAKRHALKCLEPFDCGLINPDPTIDYSWGLTCGTCNVFINDRTQTNHINGMYAVTPICFGLICDSVLWCPVICVSTCCGFLVGGSMDVFDSCYYPNERINLPQPEEESEYIAESPRRQMMK
jgi:hypothetical protein